MKNKAGKCCHDFAEAIERHGGMGFCKVGSHAPTPGIRISDKQRSSIPGIVRRIYSDEEIHLTWAMLFPPTKFDGYGSGAFAGYDSAVLSFERDRKKDRNDPLQPWRKEDPLWNNSFAFTGGGGTAVGYLIVDKKKPEAEPVRLIALDRHHPGHGLVVADSVESLIENLFPLGAVKDRQAWDDFTAHYTRPLDASCDKAKAWLDWLHS